MIAVFHKQLYRHKPEVEILGDCYRTCIANIFGLAPWEVPHFNLSHRPEFGEEEWIQSKGRQITYFDCGGTKESALEQLSALAPGEIFIFSGESRTGVNHAVLAKDGEIIHDPSLTDAGIIGPMLGSGYYMAEFILEEPTPQMKAITEECA